jgi:predicted NBD/HSP70 family sugar kinase
MLSGAGLVLDLVRRGRRRTRQELVDATGMSRSAVSQRIDALLQARLLVADARGTSRGGRRPQLLRFHPGSGIVLAVEVAPVAVRLALLDLAGHIVAEAESGSPPADGPASVLDRVADESARLAERLPADTTLHGVGVAMPETIDLPVAPRLRDQLGVPVLAGDRGDLMALAEQQRCWADTEDLVHVHVGAGIEAGVVSRGRVLRGSRGAGADIAHIRVCLRDRPRTRCHCGSDGCLNAVAGGDAVAAALSASGTPAASLIDVVGLMSQGNTAAIAQLREAGRCLGEVLAAIVCVLHPGVISVGGELGRADEVFLAGVREVVYRHGTPASTRRLRIVRSQLGERAALLGAAALAADHVLEPARVDRMLATAIA